MSLQQQVKSVSSGNPLQKLQGIEKKRVLRHFNSELASYSSSNSTEVIIDISTPRELLDFNNGYLIFDIISTGTPTGGSTGVLIYNQWAASSWIREMRIEDRSGRQIGKSVNYYNGLVRLEYEMKSNNEVNTSYLGRLEGATMFADATVATTKIQFAHRFLSHIFTSPDYFPNFALSGLRIILTMEDAANVVRSSGDRTAITSPEYTVSNLTYACDVVELMPTGMKTVMAGLNNGGLDIDYVRTHSRRTTQMVDTQQFKVGVIDGAIKNVQMLSILDTVRDGVIEDFWASFSLNNLTSYRFFLNNKPLTDKRINISATRLAEYVVEYVKSQRINLDQLVFGGSLLALASKVVIGSRFDRSTNDDVISSLRDEDNNEIEVEVEFSSTGAAATTYFYVLTDQRVKVKSNRIFLDVAVKPQMANLSTMSS